MPTVSSLRFHRILFSVIGLAAYFALSFPPIVHAADVCCTCTDPSGVARTCLTIDAAKLQNPNDCRTLPQNANLGEGWTCEQEVLSTEDSRCRAVSLGGMCAGSPKSALSLVGEAVQAGGAGGTSVADSAPIMNELNTDIPGFVFPDKATDLFSVYVSAIYRYGISIAAIATTIMFIYGAFLYLLRVKGQSDVMKGQSVMKDAIIGMVLVFSAAVIARTLNPELLVLNPINTTAVRSRTYEFINDNDYRDITGSGKVSKTEMARIAIAKAEETGVEQLPCMVEAVMRYESGGAVDAVGHDENARTTAYSVLARQLFLQSGLFYSGVPFSVVACSDASCQDQGPTNDDRFNAHDPPNYGLDWRFSHGFGPGQLTIFPHESKNRPCEGREAEGYGFRTGGTCYTIPELLTPEPAAIAMVTTLRGALAQSGNDVANAFAAYAGLGSDGVNNAAIQARVTAYESCRAKAK